MLQVQKELIWKPEEFNEDRWELSPEGMDTDSAFPVQPTWCELGTNTAHSKSLGVAALPSHIPGIQPQLPQRTKPQEAPS